MAATKKPRGKNRNLSRKYEEGTSLTHAVLQDLYFSQYSKKFTALIPNSGQLFKLWESDLVGLTDAGKLHEFEIKSSRNDWLKEVRDIRDENINDSGRKFLRHTTLSQAKMVAEIKKNKPKQKYAYIQLGEKKQALSMEHVPPTYFTIIAPVGVVKQEELPEYAGLIEFSWSEINKTYVGKIIVKPTKLHAADPTHKQIVGLTRGISLRYWRGRLME